MRKRSRKTARETDVNQLAAGIVEKATQEPTPPPGAKRKNPAAVALGKLGGKKGGPARAAKLSARKRREIARKAAVARWGKTPR